MMGVVAAASPSRGGSSPWATTAAYCFFSVSLTLLNKQVALAMRTTHLVLAAGGGLTCFVTQNV